MSKHPDSVSQASGPSEGFILVLNCGSSSIKFALYDAGVHPLPRQPMWSGRAVDIGGPNTTYADSETPEGPLVTTEEGDRTPYVAALDYIRAQVRKQLHGRTLLGVVHRVVHGGPKYSAPVRIDEQVLHGRVLSSVADAYLSG